MIHKIYNIIGILATIGLTIFSSIKGINIIFMLGYISLTYTIGYIIINAILKEKLKAFILYPIIGILVFTGISNITNIFVTSFSYLNSLPENIKSIELIETNEKYTKLFSYEDTIYYLDENFDTLIGINNKSKFEGSEISAIYNQNNLSEDLLSKLNLFTSFETSDKLSNLSNYTLHYGFLDDELTDEIIVRIIDEKNNTFYTYFAPENLKDFLDNNTLFKNHFSKGDFNLYFSEAVIEQPIDTILEEEFVEEIPEEEVITKEEIIEEETNNISTETENIEKQEKPITKVLTLSDNKYFFTDVMFVEYKENTNYKTRLNNYFNKNIMEELYIFEQTDTSKLLENEKLNFEMKKDLLLDKIQNYYVYLSDEIVKDENETIRFFTAIDSENSESKTLTDINIIEIENYSQYIIFKTNMQVNSLYSILYEK